jgi:hypothetical protein
MDWAPDSQNEFGSEGGFERIESGLLSGAPYKRHILLSEVVKQPAYLGEVFDKASVEVDKPDETSDFFEFCGWGPIFDGLYIDWVHENFAGTDDQSEIVNMGLLKFALLGSEIEIVFFKMAKNLVDDLLMFVKSSAPNKDVIEIDCNFDFSNQICEDGIHQYLESSGQVDEPKEHDTGFKKTLIHDEGCLPFIAFFDPDIVVAPLNIKLGEDLCIP